ncbi:uncharacterized protein LOC116560876 [Sapajus apella]|uniref:Uncharacterized protein LOC116560876 n=1 Tax=Sapajus apella TaxID=9515 RepID=A0A6J3J128_SAPAP|nr:uncharacterized protein LOC116560876 [Sapajus apella]
MNRLPAAPEVAHVTPSEQSKLPLDALGICEATACAVATLQLWRVCFLCGNAAFPEKLGYGLKRGTASSFLSIFHVCPGLKAPLRGQRRRRVWGGRWLRPEVQVAFCPPCPPLGGRTGIRSPHQRGSSALKNTQCVLIHQTQWLFVEKENWMFMSLTLPGFCLPGKTPITLLSSSVCSFQ